MECVLKILHLLAEIAAPCVKAFREGSEMVRGLRASAQAWQKECLEWKQKYDASESEKRGLRKELGRVKTLMTGALLFYMIYHPGGAPFFAALVILPVVHRSVLFHLADSANEYAGNAARQIPPAMRHLVERIRQGIRSWNLKWNSISLARIFRTTP